MKDLLDRGLKSALLLACCLGLSLGCAESLPEHDAPALGDLSALSFDAEPYELDYSEVVAPVHLVHLADAGEAARHFIGGEARFESPAPFRQVSWMMDAAEVSRLEFRAIGADGEATDWQAVELTFSEGDFHNALVRLDDPAMVLELRGGDFLFEAQFEFYEEVMARQEFLIGEPVAPELSEEADLRTTTQASVAPSSLVVSRAQWGAINPNKICGSVVAPWRMAIHHTAAPSSDGGNPAARMRQMQSYHINNLGWCDIGYHFVVSQSGQIFQGRSRSNRPGSHVGGQNSGNVGISFIGNFNTQTPTNTQLNAGADIVRWVHQTHNVPLNRDRVRGHREHAGQSTACPGNNLLNQINTLIARAQQGSEPEPPPPPPPTYGVSMNVRFLDIDDFYRDGSSRNIPDVLPGQQFTAEVTLTNRSSVRLEKVEIGYFIEEPFISATNYTIYTDHPHYDRKSWQVNSANSAPENPAKAALGREGRLKMHGFAPGETKRVVIEMRADEYSIGRADHPDLRAWLTYVEDVFTGHGGGWGDQATTTQLGNRVRAFAELDVLSRTEWLFNSKKHAADLEGWDVCYPGHHRELIHNTNFGALALNVAGDRACVAAPSWTRVDASAYDEMVIEFRAHNGTHHKALYWASDADLPAANFPCDEVNRVYGQSRFDSSAAVSRTEFPQGASTALLVHGERPTSDAIVGAALAAQRGGPLLLTTRDGLPDSIRQELVRLSPEEVIIIGGEAAVGAQVRQQVEALGIRVERRAGQSRFDTAAAVALEMGAPTSTAVIISAADRNLVDGVYGASLAAHLNAPVLLVQGDYLPQQTRDALRELNITETILIGGAAAIAESVEAELPAPLRLAGSNRFETAMLVAGFALQSGVSPERVFIARDDNLVDAFSASAIGEVVVLSRPDRLTPGVAAALTGYASSATIVGGPAALGEQVERDACEAFRQQKVYDLSRAVAFEAEGNSEFQTLVVPLGDFDGWKGQVRYLRLMPLYDQSPGAGESPWQDIGEIYFQNSVTQKTSSSSRPYQDGIRVEPMAIENPIDPNTGEGMGGVIGDGSTAPAGGESQLSLQQGCSATGQSAPPVGLLVLALVGLVALRRERR